MNSSHIRRSQSIFGYLCGLILLNIFKLAFYSMNPIWLYHPSEPNRISQIINLIVAFFGIISSFYYFTEKKTFWKKHSNQMEEINNFWLINSLSIGGLFYGTHKFLNGYGVISRWIGLPTFPHGGLVILVSCFSLLLFQFRFIKSPVWWIATALLGWYLMISNHILFPSSIRFIGGLLMTIFFFSSWDFVIEATLVNQKNIGKCLFFSFLIYFLLHIWDLYNVGYKCKF